MVIPSLKPYAYSKYMVLLGLRLGMYLKCVIVSDLRLNGYLELVIRLGLRPNMYLKLITQDESGILVNLDYVMITGLRSSAVFFMQRLMETN